MADGNWTFAPLADTTATFQTVQKAAPSQAEVKGTKIEVAATAPTTLQKYP